MDDFEVSRVRVTLEIDSNEHYTCMHVVLLVYYGGDY